MAYDRLNVFRDFDLDIFDDIDKLQNTLTVSQAKAEYARLAKIANRRLARIQKSEFDDTKIAQTPFFASSVRAAGLKNDRQIYGALKNVAKFAMKKTSTLTGLREEVEKSLATLHKHKYFFVTEKNVLEFRKFWKEVKEHSDYKNYSSERIAKLYKQATAKNIDPLDLAKDFSFWLDNEKKLNTMKESKEKISSDEAREILGLKKDK